MISIRCDCGEVFHAQDEHIGFQIHCRRCSTLLTVAVERTPRKGSWWEMTFEKWAPSRWLRGLSWLVSPSGHAGQEAEAATTEHRDSAAMTLARAGQIVGAYGELLESEPQGGQTVDDVRRLPFEKPVIEAALWVCLRQYGRTDFANSLESGMLFLAHYQPDVGEARIGLEGHKLEGISGSERRRVAQEMMDAYKPWSATVEAEREARAKELRAAGFLVTQ